MVFEVVTRVPVGLPDRAGVHTKVSVVAEAQAQPIPVGVPSTALDTGMTDPVAVLSCAWASPPPAATAVAATAAAMTRARRRDRADVDDEPDGAAELDRDAGAVRPARDQIDRRPVKRNNAAPRPSSARRISLLCSIARARPTCGTTWRTRCTESPSSRSSHGSRVALASPLVWKVRSPSLRSISTTRCTVR